MQLDCILQVCKTLSLCVCGWGGGDINPLQHALYRVSGSTKTKLAISGYGTNQQKNNQK